jgi:hypothetical protein
MTKPTEDYSWATDTVAEYVTNDAGMSVLVLNKEEPSNAYKLNGVLARSQVSRQYINYILNAHYKHLKYLYEGEVGDIFQTANTSTTAAQVMARFGNTWIDLGTATIFGVSQRGFQRTA